MNPEPVFVNIIRSTGIDSQPDRPVRQPICRTGPPGYIGWRNRFLGPIPGLRTRLQIRALVLH
jgi:hypothetical protein